LEREAVTGVPFHFNFQVEGVKDNKIKVFASEPSTGQTVSISIHKSKGKPLMKRTQTTKKIKKHGLPSSHQTRRENG
jgi:hypothetical protein